MIRILISSIIIALGISGAVFAIRQSADLSKLNADQRKQVNPLAQTNNAVSDKPFAEQTKQSGNKDYLSQLNEISQNFQDSEDITQSFAQNLADRIQQENPDGPAILDNGRGLNVPNPDEIALELMADAASKFDVNKLIPEIKNENLKINEENNKEAFLAYGKIFDQLTSEWRNEINNLKEETDFNQENLEQTISAYEKVISELYNLAVPKLLLNFHKTEIKYLTAELNLLGKIKNAGKDPMEAILASENLTSMDEEFNKKMNEEWQKFLKIVNSQ